MVRRHCWHFIRIFYYVCRKFSSWLNICDFRGQLSTIIVCCVYTGQKWKRTCKEEELLWNTTILGGTNVAYCATLWKVLHSTTLQAVRRPLTKNRPIRKRGHNKRVVCTGKSRKNIIVPSAHMCNKVTAGQKSTLHKFDNGKKARQIRIIGVSLLTNHSQICVYNNLIFILFKCIYIKWHAYPHPLSLQSSYYLG